MQITSTGLETGPEIGIYVLGQQKGFEVFSENKHTAAGDAHMVSLQRVTRYEQHKETELTLQCCPPNCKNPFPADTVSHVLLLCPRSCHIQICKFSTSPVLC